jgi:hypothetical protein
MDYLPAGRLVQVTVMFGRYIEVMGGGIPDHNPVN